jgi:hypothetical protein
MEVTWTKAITLKGQGPFEELQVWPNSIVDLFQGVTMRIGVPLMLY